MSLEAANRVLPSTTAQRIWVAHAKLKSSSRNLFGASTWSTVILALEEQKQPAMNYLRIYAWDDKHIVAELDLSRVEIIMNHVRRERFNIWFQNTKLELKAQTESEGAFIVKSCCRFARKLMVEYAEKLFTDTPALHVLPLKLSHVIRGIQANTFIPQQVSPRALLLSLIRGVPVSIYRFVYLKKDRSISKLGGYLSYRPMVRVTDALAPVLWVLEGERDKDIEQTKNGIDNTSDISTTSTTTTTTSTTARPGTNMATSGASGRLSSGHGGMSSGGNGRGSMMMRSSTGRMSGRPPSSSDDRNRPSSSGVGIFGLGGSNATMNTNTTNIDGGRGRSGSIGGGTLASNRGSIFGSGGIGGTNNAHALLAQQHQQQQQALKQQNLMKQGSSRNLNFNALSSPSPTNAGSSTPIAGLGLAMPSSPSGARARSPSLSHQSGGSNLPSPLPLPSPPSGGFSPTTPALPSIQGSPRSSIAARTGILRHGSTVGPGLGLPPLSGGSSVTSPASPESFAETESFALDRSGPEHDSLGPSSFMHGSFNRASQVGLGVSGNLATEHGLMSEAELRGLGEWYEQSLVGSIQFWSQSTSEEEPDITLRLDQIRRIETGARSVIYGGVGTQPALPECCVSLWFYDPRIRRKQLAEIAGESEGKDGIGKESRRGSSLRGSMKGGLEDGMNGSDGIGTESEIEGDGSGDDGGQGDGSDAGKDDEDGEKRDGKEKLTRREKKLKKKEKRLAKIRNKYKEDLIPLHIEFPTHGLCSAWLFGIYHLMSLVRARTPPDFSIPTHDDPLGASSTTFGAQVVVDPYEEEKAMSALRDSIKSGQFSFLFNKCDPPCPIPKGCFYAPPFVYQSSNNQRVGQLMYPVKLPFTAPLTNGKKSKPLYQIKVDDDDGSFIMANDGYLYDPDTKERIGMLQTETVENSGIPVGAGFDTDEEEEEDEDNGSPEVDEKGNAQGTEEEKGGLGSETVGKRKKGKKIGKKGKRGVHGEDTGDETNAEGVEGKKAKKKKASRKGHEGVDNEPGKKASKKASKKAKRGTKSTNEGLDDIVEMVVEQVVKKGGMGGVEDSEGNKENADNPTAEGKKKRVLKRRLKPKSSSNGNGGTVMHEGDAGQGLTKQGGSGGSNANAGSGSSETMGDNAFPGAPVRGRALSMTTLHNMGIPYNASDQLSESESDVNDGISSMTVTVTTETNDSTSAPSKDMSIHGDNGNGEKMNGINTSLVTPSKPAFPAGLLGSISPTDQSTNTEQSSTSTSSSTSSSTPSSLTSSTPQPSPPPRTRNKSVEQDVRASEADGEAEESDGHSSHVNDSDDDDDDAPPARRLEFGYDGTVEVEPEQDGTLLVGVPPEGNSNKGRNDKASKPSTEKTQRPSSPQHKLSSHNGRFVSKQSDTVVPPSTRRMNKPRQPSESDVSRDSYSDHDASQSKANGDGKGRENGAEEVGVEGLEAGPRGKKRKESCVIV